MHHAARSALAAEIYCLLILACVAETPGRFFWSDITLRGSE